MNVERPKWLVVKAPHPQALATMQTLFGDLELHTICENAECPNIGECFNLRTASFMILGNICTRSCRFCAVGKGKPGAVDPEEPARLAQAVKKLALKHVVVTSVTRDDLPDGGARQFAASIQYIRALNLQTTIEVLIPDFRGNVDALKTVVEARPNVVNHNIETVPRLYSTVRPQADYRRSLKLLATSKDLAPNIASKSGIMVGLGETEEEMLAVFRDLRNAYCDVLTVGQYLRPSLGHLEVKDYISPDVFDRYKEKALALGFKHVAAGPLVRSSYKALEGINLLMS
ncbi:MAG: lipoyl synthase [Desulfitobacteriaceae bacterium]